MNITDNSVGIFVSTVLVSFNAVSVTNAIDNYVSISMLYYYYYYLV